MAATTTTREKLYNLLGSEVRLSPAMTGLGLAFGTYREPWFQGRLQNVDATFATLELADGSQQKVFVNDIFDVDRAPR